MKGKKRKAGKELEGGSNKRKEVGIKTPLVSMFATQQSLSGLKQSPRGI
jgi:hypothetical protein